MCRFLSLGPARRGSLAAIVLLAFATTSSVSTHRASADEATAGGDEPAPKFTHDILPLLRKNCLACHHSKLAEGGLSLESLESLSTGGDSGAAIDVDSPADSLLLVRARGEIDAIMPPEDNDVGAVPFEEAEIQLIERWIASGAGDSDAPTDAPQEYHPLPDGLRAIYSVAYAPEGGWAAVGRGNTIAIVDESTGRTLSHLSDPALLDQFAEDASPSQTPFAQIDFVNALAIHPHGDVIASGDFRGVRIWRRSGTPTVTLAATSEGDQDLHRLLRSMLAGASAGAGQGSVDDAARQRAGGWDIGGSLQHLILSADAKRAVTTTSEGVTRLWDWGDGRSIADLAPATAARTDLRRMQADVARQTEFVEFLNGQVAPAEELLKKEEEALKAAEEEAQKQKDAVAEKQAALAEAKTNLENLASADPPATDEQKAEAQKQVDERTAAVTEAEAQAASAAQALAAANDTRDRAAASVETIKAEIQSEQERLGTLQNAHDAQAQQIGSAVPLAVRFSPTGDRVACVYADGNVTVFNSENGNRVASFHGGPADQCEHLYVDATWVAAAAGPDAPIIAWRLDSLWHLERTIGGIDGPSPFVDRITALDFSPDGRHLVVGGGAPSRSGNVHVVDTTTWEITASWMDAHSDVVQCVRVSPDGRWLATSGADRQVHVFDFPSGEKLRTLEGHTHHVLGIDWQNHGRRLVSVSADATVKIWNVRTSESERTISPGGKEISSITFVGAGSQFAIASGEGNVRLYNADDGALLRTYGAVSGYQYAVAASAAGNRILAGGHDGTVRIWDTEKPEILHENSGDDPPADP